LLRSSLSLCCLPCCRAGACVVYIVNTPVAACLPAAALSFAANIGLRCLAPSFERPPSYSLCVLQTAAGRSPSLRTGSRYIRLHFCWLPSVGISLAGWLAGWLACLSAASTRTFAGGSLRCCSSDIRRSSLRAPVVCCLHCAFLAFIVPGLTSASRLRSLLERRTSRRRSARRGCTRWGRSSVSFVRSQPCFVCALQYCDELSRLAGLVCSSGSGGLLLKLACVVLSLSSYWHSRCCGTDAHDVLLYLRVQTRWCTRAISPCPSW
jgi:ABC-type Co2+ transport system permease subunit